MTDPSFFRAQAIRVKKAKGRKVSSQRWLQRHLNDPYVQQAKMVGYRSRAAFKIREIHEKFNLFKAGQTVVDLGASPGGWSQVVTEFVKANNDQKQIFAIDLLPLDPIAGVTYLQGDFLDAQIQQQMHLLIGQKVDVVLSDMAAPTTGHRATDHIRTCVLVDAAFSFAQKNLKDGGTFISKVFAGGTQQELLIQLKKHFKHVRHFKPASSRKESPEVYVVCQEFHP